MQTWVNGIEDAEFVGVGARFGRTIVSKEKNARHTRLVLSDPRDCCSPPKNKVLSSYMTCCIVLWSRVWQSTEIFVVQLCIRLWEMSLWWIEGTAPSQRRQKLHKLLMLQLSSS